MTRKRFPDNVARKIASDLQRQRSARGDTRNKGPIGPEHFVAMLETLANEIRVVRRNAKTQRRQIGAAQRAIANVVHRLGDLSGLTAMEVAHATQKPLLVEADLRACRNYERSMRRLLDQLRSLDSDFKAALEPGALRPIGDYQDSRLLLAMRVVVAVSMAGVRPSCTKGGFASRCLAHVYVLAGITANPDGYIARAVGRRKS
jgi:hypothetical protein